MRCFFNAAAPFFRKRKQAGRIPVRRRTAKGSGLHPARQTDTIDKDGPGEESSGPDQMENTDGFPDDPGARRGRLKERRRSFNGNKQKMSDRRWSADRGL